MIPRYFCWPQTEELCVCISVQYLCLLVYSLWIFSKYQKVANVVRWGGPMALWEKPKRHLGQGTS